MEAKKPQVMTLSEAARELRVHSRTLRKLVLEGRFPGVKLSENCIRIPAEAVRRALRGEKQ